MQVNSADSGLVWNRSANTLDPLAGHGFGKRSNTDIRSTLNNLDPLLGMGFGKRSTAQDIDQMMRYMRVKQLLEQFRKIPDQR